MANICTWCAETFNTPNELKNHVLIWHDVELYDSRQRLIEASNDLLRANRDLINHVRLLKLKQDALMRAQTPYRHVDRPAFGGS